MTDASVGPGLLDLLAQNAGCDYLSDLHCNNKLLPDVQCAVRGIPPARYNLSEWTDAVRYLLGDCPDFETPQQAIDFLLSAQ